MSDISEILLKQNLHWQKKDNNVEYIDRELLERLKIDSKFIEIITGVRRSGKSTIFNILINFLITNNKADKKEILFVNFDNPNFIPFYKNVDSLDEIIEQAENIGGKKIKYLFLDEIQNIDFWEKWVKAAYDQKDFKKIYITGSNSDLLSNQYISRLSGRYFAYTNFPFSYKEYLKQKKQKYSDNYLDNYPEKHKFVKHFDKYLTTGGFPEVLIENDSDIIDSYYQTILLNDVIANNNIRDAANLKELAYYLVSGSTCFHSYNNITKNLNINENTVKEYIGYLKSAYLFFELKKYDYSLKKQNINKKKIYIIDNGFINKIGFNFSSNSGKYLENLIMIELLRRGKEVFYHYKNFECDFVIKEKNKISSAIQVCYDLNDKNKEREMNGLMDALREYKLASGIIITRMQKEEIKVDNKKVYIVPAWEWLLNHKNNQ